MKSIWAVAFLFGGGALNATTFFYTLTIDNIASGPLAGMTGTGSFSYDDAFKQNNGSMDYVDPSNGLLSFSLTINSTTLDISNAVNNGAFPLIFLIAATGETGSIWAVWGSTGGSGTAGPGYRIATAFPGNGDADGFFYDSQSFGFMATHDVSPVLGFSSLTGSPDSTGRVSWTLDSTIAGVPEPASAGFLLAGLAALAALRGLRRRRA